MSAIDTAEFRKLTLLAAGIDPTEIPPVLDTAEWRRLLIVAIEQATAGGGGGGGAVSSVNTKTGAVVLNAADVGAVNKTGDTVTGTLDILPGSLNVGNFDPNEDIPKIQINPSNIQLINGATIEWGGDFASGSKDALRSQINAAGTIVTNTFSVPQIISTSSTNTALRVTQAGTGESLRIEDSTHPDATPFVISNNGRVGVGVTPASGTGAAAISVDSGGIRFSDATIQTTAANLPTFLSGILSSQGMSSTELETITRNGGGMSAVSFTSTYGFFTMFTPLVNIAISNLGFFISSTATGSYWQAGIYLWNDNTLVATPQSLTANDPTFLNATTGGSAEYRVRSLSSPVNLIAGSRYAIGVRGTASFGTISFAGFTTSTNLAATAASSSPVMALMWEPSTLPTTPTVLSRSPLPAGRIYTKMT